MNVAAVELEQTAPALPFRFVWVGDLGDPEMAQACPALEFLGPDANPFRHVARFDVFCLPSRDDPFPLVVLEAMSLGVPVVAFDVGGVREQVGDTGLLVPPEDTSALAEALETVAADPELRARLGRAARARAWERFSFRSFADQVDNLVRGVD